MPPEALFENHYTALKQCRHGYFLFNRNDTFIGRSLDLYGEWCESEVEALFQLIQPGSLIVDIGANIGTHTIPFARKTTNTGLVLAFEPQAIAYRYLCANAVLNNLLNIVCLNKAVGESPGSIRVPILNPEVETNFGALGLDNSTGVPTEMISLDGLGLKNCELMKIDVEGMEPKVLDGARNTIHKLRPLIFVETTTVNSAAVIERLRDLRYDCWWDIAGYYNPSNFFGNSDNVFNGIHPESNLLCSPKEAKLEVTGLEPVLGNDDSWPAALERMKTRLNSRQAGAH